MTHGIILQALANELKNYSSLNVVYNDSTLKDPMNRQTLYIAKVGCKHRMRISVVDGKLKCLKVSPPPKTGQTLSVYVKGSLDLADPKCFEKLLALLKRELR